MVIEIEAVSSQKTHISKSILISGSLHKGWILQTKYAFCNSSTLLLARASWSLSMKVKVLNANFFSKLIFGLLKKLIPKKPPWFFYIFTLLRFKYYKLIQLSSFSCITVGTQLRLLKSIVLCTFTFSKKIIKCA